MRRSGPALAVAGLTVLGVLLRVRLAHEPLFADELSTYWIVSAHGLGGVVSTVHTDAEITPPLFFALSWLGAQIGHAPELLRLPSLVAGAATIPLVFALGRRTVGRPAALVATALTALAPFMAYYAAEARGYALMMCLVVLSTLALVRALQDGGRAWWVVYALASCGAMYSHYTAAFALVAQLGWALWFHAEARKAVLLANLGAAVLFLPWASGLHNDLTSPTSRILSALSPFTPGDVRVALEHWTVGYPYATLPLRELPGTLALILIALGVLVATGALLARRPRLRVRPEIVLVALLALSVPVGEALASAVSTNLFGTRNLAASWPAGALLVSALLVAAGPRLRWATAGAVIAGVLLGTIGLLDRENGRPDYRAGAALVAAASRSGDVVIDQTGVLSPGPFTGLDAAWEHPRRPVVRSGAPAERTHPFSVFDPIVQSPDAIRRATRLVGPRGRVYVVKNTFPSVRGITQRLQAIRNERFPAGWRQVGSRTWPGRVNGVVVLTYARG